MPELRSASPFGSSFFTSSSISRRAILSGALAAAALPALAACSTSGGAGGMGQPKGNTPDKYKNRTRVVLWMPWSGAKEQLTKFLDEFNESQKDVYAEMQLLENYDVMNEKLSAALQAKQVPDIVGLGSGQWTTFLLNDTLEPLDDHFSGDFKPSSFQKIFISEGQVNNKTWWIPFGRSTPVMYYNRNLFKTAGLPDRTPETWTELREWGNQIKGMNVQGNAIKMTAFNLADNGWLFNAPLWAFGGRYSKGMDVTIDKSPAIEAAQFEFDMINKDKIAYGSQNTGTDFTNGLLAVTTESTGALTGILETAKFDVGVGFLPKEKEQGVPTGGGGLSIMRGASDERKKAAAQVLKFLTTPERVAAWSLSTGYIPTTTAALETSTMKSKYKEDPRYKVGVDQLKIARYEDDGRRFMPVTAQLTLKSLQTLYTSGNTNPEASMKALGKAFRQNVDAIRPDYEKAVGK